MNTTYDILDVEATVKMLTDRYSQTNRLYGNTDKQIIIINTQARVAYAIRLIKLYNPISLKCF